MPSPFKENIRTSIRMLLNASSEAEKKGHPSEEELLLKISELLDALGNRYPNIQQSDILAVLKTIENISMVSRTTLSRNKQTRIRDTLAPNFKSSFAQAEQAPSFKRHFANLTSEDLAILKTVYLTLQECLPFIPGNDHTIHSQAIGEWKTVYETKPAKLIAKYRDLNRDTQLRGYPTRNLDDNDIDKQIVAFVKHIIKCNSSLADDEQTLLDFFRTSCGQDTNRFIESEFNKRITIPGLPKDNVYAFDSKSMLSRRQEWYVDSQGRILCDIDMTVNAIFSFGIDSYTLMMNSNGTDVVAYQPLTPDDINSIQRAKPSPIYTAQTTIELIPDGDWVKVNVIKFDQKVCGNSIKVDYTSGAVPMDDMQPEQKGFKT